jgi:hypothetical protein
LSRDIDGCIHGEFGLYCRFVSTNLSTRFGAVYLLLQLIPVLSMLFLLTTAAGSSLWAVKLENDGSESTLMPPQPEEEDMPPPYEDDPV